MLEVIAAADHYRLATVEALETELAMVGVLNPDASHVEAILSRVSAAISTYCGRVFAREEVRQTWVHRTTPRELLLARYPVVTLDAVTIDGEEIDPAELSLDKTIGQVFAGPMGTAGSTVVMEYTAGFILPGEEGANLPADIELAALTAGRALYLALQRDGALKAEEIDGLGRQEYFASNTRSPSYFNDAEPLLQPYRTAEAR